MPRHPAACARRVAALVLVAFAATAPARAQGVDADVDALAPSLRRLADKLMAGDADAADAHAQELVAQGEAGKSWLLLNGVAWAIVDPGAKVDRRNLELARRAATLAIGIVGETEPSALDTLARVHAWEGDVAKAAATQQRVMALLPKSFAGGMRGELAAAAIEYDARLRASAPKSAKTGPRVPDGCAPATAAAVEGWCKVVVHKATGVRLRFVAGGEYWIGMAPGDLDGLSSSVPPEKLRQTVEGESPQRRVRVSPFYLAECEVSVAQWRKFAAATGYLSDAELDSESVLEISIRVAVTSTSIAQVDSDATWQDPLPEVRRLRQFTLLDTHPVTMVTWNDAMMFCAVNGLRLPTEAEWEFAARGGVAARYWWGPDPADGKDKDNVLDRPAPSYPIAAVSSAHFPFHDGHSIFAPVDALAPNPFGLRGMIGNVSEWCADPGNRRPYEVLPADVAAVDPVMAKPPDEPYMHVGRGGAWLATPPTARVSVRTLSNGPAGAVTVGFRPALAAK
ncbi:MAG: formylglycine-generating enzyme family protein [Planctomycetota bacterium]